MTDPRALDRGLVLPGLFLVFALLTALFLVWNMPPFQAPDELSHLDRANLTTAGRLVAKRVRSTDGSLVAGGLSDVEIWLAQEPFADLPFNPRAKADQTDYARAATVAWDAPRLEAPFPGSATYPPFAYLPQSAAILGSKIAGKSIVDTLYLARAANALACGVVGFLAIALARRSRLFLFSLLLLPTATSLYAAVTNDGMLIALGALGAAAVARPLHEGRPMRGGEIVLASVCFALLGMTKLPYALMAFVLLAAPAEKPRQRWAAVTAVLLVSVGWMAWMAASVQTPLNRPGMVIDPGGQFRFLLSRPWAVVSIAMQTLSASWTSYATTFVGVLGWLDTPLPRPFYPLAWMVLGLAALAAASRGRSLAWKRAPAAAALTVALVCGAIFGALYVGWNPVAAPAVEGVAGRYFLPVAALFCLCLEGERPAWPQTRWGLWLSRAATAAVLVFPLVSLMAVQRAVILRYYLD